MSFNPEPSKQAQVIFTRKVNKVVHRPIFFNNKPVQQVLSQKHLGLLYDEHNNAITSKFSKTIGLLPKLDNHLSWPPLITIYKSFKRPHVDYSDVMFDKAYKNSFQQRLESLQYKAWLARTGAIKGSSTEKLYLELWLESLQNREWFWKLCIFYKIVKNNTQNIYWTSFFQITIHNKQEIAKTWWFHSLK